LEWGRSESQKVSMAGKSKVGMVWKVEGWNVGKTESCEWIGMFGRSEIEWVECWNVRMVGMWIGGNVGRVEC